MLKASRAWSVLQQDTGKRLSQRTTIGNHLAAFLSATAAGLGTGLTVRVFVLRTFGCADFADLSAEGADFRCMGAAARHITGGKTAQGSAVQIVADAVLHHAHVVFGKAGCGAVVAGISTVVALGHAGAVGVFAHEGLLCGKRLKRVFPAEHWFRTLA